MINQRISFVAIENKYTKGLLCEVTEMRLLRREIFTLCCVCRHTGQCRLPAHKPAHGKKEYLFRFILEFKTFFWLIRHFGKYGPDNKVTSDCTHYGYWQKA